MLSEGFKDYIIHLALETKYRTIKTQSFCENLQIIVELHSLFDYYEKLNFTVLLFYMYFWYIDKETELKTNGG